MCVKIIFLLINTNFLNIHLEIIERLPFMLNCQIGKQVCMLLQIAGLWLIKEKINKCHFSLPKPVGIYSLEKRIIFLNIYLHLSKVWWLCSTYFEKRNNIVMVLSFVTPICQDN